MDEERLKVRTWFAHCRRLVGQWRHDSRGTSMVTTAITMPLFIVILFGIWYLYLIMGQKAALHNGVIDATHYISENARYWNIGEESNVGGDLLPGDYYEMQARRMIESRLRDVIFFSPEMLTDTLTVRVEEPLLAFPPDAQEDPIEIGWVDDLCYYKANQPGEFRYWKNIRFRVYAEFKVPLWQVRIPYMGSFDVTLSDRAMGYVQCPRWRGKREADNLDKSKYLASEGPFMKFRNLSTPVPVIPTVTERPEPTKLPTSTTQPTNPPP